MKTEGQAHLLRVFVNESDRWEGRPLYEAIIRAAKEKGLAGATALRGIEGYGTSGRVHSVKVLHLSEDVPIVVELLDAAERIAVFLPVLDKMVAEGAVTIEKVHLVLFRRDSEQAAEIQFDEELQLDTEEAATIIQNSVSPASLELTDRAHQIIIAARESAAESRRVYVDSVDVLLAMLGETRGLAENALRHLGIDCRAVKRLLHETVSRDELSAAYLKALTAKSTAAAKWLEDEYIGAEHLLLALCQIRPSVATDILTRLGAQPRDICQEVLTVVGHDGDWQRWLADHPEL
jgi:PII-like signaling protein